MSIQPSLLQQTGQLWHGPSELVRAESIARHGIVPGSDLESLGLGSRAYTSDQASRDGFVYLGTREHIFDRADMVIPLFRVDVTQLDPMLVSSDEDHFAIYTYASGDPELLADLAERFPLDFRLGPRRRSGYEPRVHWRRASASIGQPPTYSRLGASSHGQWANQSRNAAFLAREDVAAFALERGAIAYEGTVTPELLSVDVHLMARAIKERTTRWMSLTDAEARSCLAAMELLGSPEEDIERIRELCAPELAQAA
jgi:hypothetical protein